MQWKKEHNFDESHIVKQNQNKQGFNLTQLKSVVIIVH